MCIERMENDDHALGDTGVAAIVKRHLPAIMQLMTNEPTLKRYNMQMNSTKCLNTAIMMMYLFLSPEVIEITQQCDVENVIDGYEHVPEVTTDDIQAAISKGILRSIFRKDPHSPPELHYVMITDGDMKHDERADRAVYFPGHVFVIERGVGGNVFRLYQSYIGEYDVTQHDALIEKEVLRRRLKDVCKSFDRRVWTLECSRAWSALTHVAVKKIHKFEGHVRKGVLFLCHRVVPYRESMDTLRSIAERKLDQLNTNISVDVENSVWGDPVLLPPSYLLKAIRLLTVREMRSELTAILREIDEKKAQDISATTAASSPPSSPPMPVSTTTAGGASKTKTKTKKENKTAATKAKTKTKTARTASKKASTPAKTVRVDDRGSHMKDAIREVKAKANEGKPTLVFVNRPDCGYCHMMRPDFEDAAHALNRAGYSVIDLNLRGLEIPFTGIPFVDLSVVSLIKGSGIMGVPHIIRIKKGANGGYTFDSFDGQRTSANLVKFGRGASPP